MSEICSVKGEVLVVKLDGDLDHHVTEIIREEIDNKTIKYRIRNIIFDFRVRDVAEYIKNAFFAFKSEKRYKSMKRTIKVSVPINGFSAGKPPMRCCPCGNGKCKLCCRSPSKNNRSKGSDLAS